MDLQQLSTFCVIVSEKNMTTAASQLKVTQPTVSRQIRLLEAELGVELLERGGGRVVQPTVQGQLFYEYAKNILNLIKKACSDVQSLPQYLDDHISLVTINYFGLSLVAPVVFNFLQPSNRFQISLAYTSAVEIIEKMKKKEVDVAILPRIDQEYGVSIPHYDHHFLFKDHLLFVGSKKDVSLPEQIEFKNINDRPLVWFSSVSPQFKKYIQSKQTEHDVQLKSIFEINNLGTLKKVVEQGLYWGFMPSSGIQKQIRYGRLSPVKIENVEYSMDIHAYVLKEIENKKFVEMLLMMLKKHSTLFYSNSGF